MHRQTLHLRPEELRIKLESLLCFVSMETSLKTRPGSIHWHIKHSGEASGTLEATWLASGEAWLSVHKNRQAEWIGDIIRKIT